MFLKKGKFFILLGLIGTTTVSCQKNPQKPPKSEPGTINSLYELPSADREKAAKLNLELAVGYLNQDQIARAKAKFIRARELAPNLPEVHYSYGFFLERVGEKAEAEKAYLKALSLNGKGGNEHNMYGAFLCRNNKYKLAEKEFLKAVEDPNFTQTAEALENAGLCVLQIPDMAKAIEYFERALRYDINRPNALLELAVLKLQLRKFEEAKEYYARYSQLSKPSARSLLLAVEIAKHFHDAKLEQRSKLLLNAQYPNAKAADLYSRKG